MKNILKINNRYHFLSGIIAFVTSIFFFFEIYAIQKLIYIAEGNKSNLVNNIIFILAIYIISYALYYCKLRIFNKTEYMNKKHLTTLYFNSILKYDMDSFVNKNIASEVNTMVNNNFDIVNKHYYSAIYDIVYGFTFVICGLVYLTYINWKISLISILFFIISLISVKLFSSISDKLNDLKIKSLTELLNVSKDLHNSAIHLVVYNSINEAVCYIKKYISNYSYTTSRLNISQQLFSIINDSISGYREYIVLFFILYLSKITDLNIVFVIIYLSTNISVPFTRLIEYINTIKSSKTIRENILKSITDVKESKVSTICNNIESIKLEDIWIGFEEKSVIEKFNYTFKNNNKYLIIGESGSGKSTLLDIILGIKKPSKGKVYINNELLKSENMILGLYSYISQNEILFNTSIKENIVLFNKNYNIDKYKTVLSLLNIKLKDNTVIDNSNLNISGGELQKILLARALYHNHNFIIFDEAFSSLDSSSLYELEKIVLNLKNVMILNVAHYTAENSKNLYEDIIEI